MFCVHTPEGFDLIDNGKEYHVRKIPNSSDFAVITDSFDKIATFEVDTICHLEDIIATSQKAIAEYELELANEGYMFKIGEEYETQCGKLVKVLSRGKTDCIKCSDGSYRYDRKGGSSDSGRVTGTNHDYSHPDNFKRADKKVRTLKDFAVEAGGTNTKFGLSDAVLMTNKDLAKFKIRIEEQFRYKCKRVGALTTYNVLVNKDTPEAEDCLNYPVYLFPEDRED